METEFQNAVGKGKGEVMRDISEFLSVTYRIHKEKKIDLCSFLPELNMYGQFSFALLSEAQAQGWERDAAENFYRGACSGVMEPALIEHVIAAFREPTGDDFRDLRLKYGNRFTLLDGSYWSTLLAIGIDAGQVGDVMQYLRLFTVCLMEFAYMDDRNPNETYTWSYYESFRKMLDALTTEGESEPKPLKVRAVGGTAGKREQEGYSLSLGLDIENPNPDRMARGVSIDITLKDRDGNVITVIGDKLESLDPGAVYHYGITRRIRGAAVGSIAATAKASSHLRLQTPIMKHTSLSGLRLSETESGMRFSGTLTGEYDRPLRTMTLHYQFLSRENRILGGGCEWILDGVAPGEARAVSVDLPVKVKNAAKVVYSVDFDALELI